MKKIFLLAVLFATVSPFFLFAGGSQEAAGEPLRNSEMIVEIRHCDS